MNFVSALLTHTTIYESPSSFWKWSAYAAISAVLRDNMYRKHGDSYLYPNTYILLLADSAVQRKGRPIELCENLVKKVANTKIISGRTSIQAVLDELGKAETSKTSGKLVKGGSAIFFAPELSAGIVNDVASVNILTDIYDYKEGYKESLRGRGNFEIDKIVFNLFAGSNEALLKDVYDTRAIFGGLLGRTFVVKPNEFRRGASLSRTPDTNGSFTILLALLQEIARWAEGLNKDGRGRVELTDAAADEYDGWYIPFRDSYRGKSDNSGVAGRIHTGIYKLAMILAANEHSNSIELHHIEQAISECMELIPNYKGFTLSSGKSDLAAAGGILITALLAAPKYTMTKKSILRNHWQDIDLESLDKLTTQLDQAGAIIVSAMGSEITYSLTKSCLEEMGVQS